MTDGARGGALEHRSRRGYLDALRGIAVLVMIEAHLIDSWTRFPDRQTSEYGWALTLGGFGAPLFLFLAGVAVPLSAGSKQRRTGSTSAASAAVARRGLEIFGLAFLFRIQAWILGWGPVRSLLKVDILNIMGPAIVAAAWLWGAARTQRGRFMAFTTATLGIALLTPLVRTWSVLARLADPIAAYIRPSGGLSNFVFFPWAAFVFAGAIAGLILDEARTPEGERRANIGFAVVGTTMAVVGYFGSFLPSPYPQSHFWTTSPAFFFLRVGVLTAAISVLYLWDQRPGASERWSPLQQLGRTSLFIYWIHVEMIYGLISVPWHQSLSLPQAWFALVIFSLFMLACSVLKDRAVDWWKSSKGHGQPAASPGSLA